MTLGRDKKKTGLKLHISVSIALCIFCPILVTCSCTRSGSGINGGIEKTGRKHKPLGWMLISEPGKSGDFNMTLDSVKKIEGSYSLSIHSLTNHGTFGAASYDIPVTYKGRSIELRGYMKTENVTNGFAGLWLRLDGVDGMLAIDNMQDRGISGTNDWKEYRIKIPYDDEKTTSISIGGILVGRGTIWIDDLRLYVDNKPIENTPIKTLKLPRASLDTFFNHGSTVNKIILNKESVPKLKILGEIWGFLKYYHPLIAKGDFNMDAELFRVLPKIITAKSDKDFSIVLEKWVDHFGVPTFCKDCDHGNDKILLEKTICSEIFTNSKLSKSLVRKFRYIFENRNRADNYYVDLEQPAGNPVFKHEQPYLAMPYPDAGVRLLSLYRYWNIIEYFYPYKHLIGIEWENELQRFIPEFINAKDTASYLFATLKLISSIHDSHANIFSYHKALEDSLGKLNSPVQARFIEDKLVITGFYLDTLNVRDNFRMGDIINSVNGVNVTDLVSRYIQMIPGSNRPSQLRDIARNYLLRSRHYSSLLLGVTRDDKKRTLRMPMIERSKLDFSIDYDPTTNSPAFGVLKDRIGYIYAGKYKNKDLIQIKTLFNNTRGIIIDLRCYPGDPMLSTLVPYIKKNTSEFAKLTFASVQDPGVFRVGLPVLAHGNGEYNKPVVVIVNEQTQSAAEYAAMALQSSGNVTLIGSATAGADGNVSAINLPGGISTKISGIGVFYPDGAETQRVGLRIDHEFKQTINGVKNGRDELLMKALEILNPDHKQSREKTIDRSRQYY